MFVALEAALALKPKVVRLVVLTNWDSESPRRDCAYMCGLEAIIPNLPVLLFLGLNKTFGRPSVIIFGLRCKSNVGEMQLW